LEWQLDCCDTEQMSLQLAAENAKRRYRPDAGQQCIPGSGGRHRESLVADCEVMGVIIPCVSSDVAARGAMDGICHIC